MNPLLLVGLAGLAAAIASSKKKKEEDPEERRYSGPPQMISKAAKLPMFNIEKLVMAKVAMPKQSYKTQIAMKGPSIAMICHKHKGMRTIENVARCVAAELFPIVGWPVTNESEAWERDAWHRIINVSRAEFGLGPLPKRQVINVSGEGPSISPPVKQMKFNKSPPIKQVHFNKLG